MSAEAHRNRARIVLLGARGQLGSCLAARLANANDVICLDRSTGDLTRPERLAGLMQQLRPHIVVNAAAHTAVDRAESEIDLSRAVNALAPGELGKICAQIDALLVHISTDYVFDGTAPGPYREDDPTAPLNAYGRHKREGEERIAASAARYIVARTSLVYAAGFRNFARTMLELAMQRAELAVVDDQWSNPTYAPHLATGLANLMDRYLQGDETRRRELSGLYHLAAPDFCSRYEFVAALIEAAAEYSPALRQRLLVRRLLPVSSSAFPLPARRPARPLLDCSRLQSHAGIQLPPWRDALREYVLAVDRTLISGRTNAAVLAAASRL